MDLEKKYATKALTFSIIIFLVALFYSIYAHIDGLGIFALVLAIMFFSLLLYLSNKHVSRDHKGDAGPTTNDMSHYIQVVTNPMFIRLLPSLLTVIFSYLERHKDKIERAAAHQLQEDLQLTLNKFKEGFSHLRSHEQITSDDVDPHKPKKSS